MKKKLLIKIFIILVTFALALGMYLYVKQSGLTLLPVSTFDPHAPLNAFEYDNAYYEAIVNNSAFIKRNSLPDEITNDMVGDFLGTAGDNLYYSPFDGMGINLYECKSINGDIIIIAEDYNNKYYYAIFCNFLDSNTKSYTSQDLFNKFGIDSADDIESIGVMSPNRIMINRSVNNRTVIEQFYGEYISLFGTCMNDYYSSDIFKKPKNEPDDGSRERAIAKDMKILYLKLNSGLYIYLSYYPSINYIHNNIIIFKIPQSMTDLINNKILRVLRKK